MDYVHSPGEMYPVTRGLEGYRPVAILPRCTWIHEGYDWWADGWCLWGLPTFKTCICPGQYFEVYIGRPSI